MRSEIEDLRNYRRQTNQILSALVSGESSSHVLEQLRAGEPVESVAERLQRSGSADYVPTHPRMSEQAIRNSQRRTQSIGSASMSALAISDAHAAPAQPPHDPNLGNWQTYEPGPTQKMPHSDMPDDMMYWISDTGSASHIDTGRTTLGYSGSQSTPGSVSIRTLGLGQEAILGREFGLDEQAEPQHHNYNDSWTTITADGAFLEHLLALYFCWEYPTFASLSKEHFLEDFRSGRRRHCSSLLVNTILALGCRFSKQASARTDPNDSNTAGDHFFAEAKRLLLMEKERHILTTIQALGLMAIRESSSGRSSASIFLAGQSMRLAIEMGLHRDAQYEGIEIGDVERAVRSATFWGAFSLDQ